MRNAVLLSGLLHLTAMVVLFALRVSSPSLIAGSDVVQVALVDPPPSPARPLPQPPVERVPEKEIKLEPTDDAGVKVEPKKPSKKKPEKKVEKPLPEPEPAPTETTIPYTPLGRPGLRGQVAVDGADFEFTYYLLLIRNRIAENWSPPAGLVTRGQPVQAVVYFRIARNGSIFATQVETSSGVDFFDRSSLRAVQISDPLPPLPVGFSGSDLGVHFGFEFASP